MTLIDIATAVALFAGLGTTLWNLWDKHRSKIEGNVTSKQTISNRLATVESAIVAIKDQTTKLGDVFLEMQKHTFSLERLQEENTRQNETIKELKEQIKEEKRDHTEKIERVMGMAQKALSRTDNIKGVKYGE